MLIAEIASPCLNLPPELETGALSRPFNKDCVISALYEVSSQIWPQADAYDLVVGEDTSGRLSALVIRGVVNAKRSAIGVPAAKIRFISGQIDVPLPNGFLPEPEDEQSRALIVSEYVETGTSISRVRDSMADTHVWDRGSIDTASISQPNIHNLITYSSEHLVTSYLYGSGGFKSGAKGVKKDQGPCFSSKLSGCGEEVAAARASVKAIVANFSARLVSERF